MIEDLATTKRRFLRHLAMGAGGLVFGSSTTVARSSYGNTVDIVEAGADDTGTEPINDVLETVVADDTLVEFPPGTYLMDREFAYEDARHVGLVGTGGSVDTTILIEDTFQDANIFDFGTSGSLAADGIEFRGFTIDVTTPGAGAGVFWAYCLDGCYIEDVVVDGIIEGELPSGKGEILVRVDVMNSDGTGTIRGFSAPDGAEYPGSGQPATGLYVGGAHAGSITIENCEIAGFQDNGVYTSPAADAGGSVEILGGRYANNDVSNVRVGGESTLVEGVTVVQESIEGFIYNNPRGIWARNGNATIRDVDVTYKQGASEAIQAGSEMGRLDLENVRIHQTTDELTVRLVPNASTFTADGLTVVAEGDGRQVMNAEDWTCSVANSCVEATDGSRDGLIFTSSDAEVSDSNVNVSGTAIDGATTTNVTYEETCSLNSDPTVAVSTDGTTGVGEVSATLEGTLDDLGGASSADVAFDVREVGASSWTTTAWTTLSSTGSYNESISGLDDGIEYEFRAAAVASDGDTDTGTAATFSTTDDPPVVTTGSASSVGDTSATLDGSLDDLGQATSVDVGFDYRGVDSDTWSRTAVTALESTGPFSRSISGLDPGTEYEFRAVGTASDGDQATGSTATFATTGEQTDHRPSIDAYSVSEAGSPNPHASISADWSVSDADGNLDRVTVAVNDAAGALLESSTTAVAGASASGTDEFFLKHVSGQTFDLKLTVVDASGGTTEAVQSVTE